MWSKSIRDMHYYEAIRENIKKGVYNEENLSFWKKIFRISYTHNPIGIYKEIYLFNKKVYCNLVCRYTYI